MLVGPKCQIQDKHLTVYLNKTEFQQTTSIKLLGINVDSYLNWKTHVESVISKVSVKVGLLHRLSRFLPSFHLRYIYTAVVQSSLDYEITIWGSCFKTCCHCNVFKNRWERISYILKCIIIKMH